MVSLPSFKDKTAALDSAKEIAQRTGTSKFVLCLAGRYLIKSSHTPGPLASWYAEVFPDGTTKESF